ncbi:MAG: aminopeptidase [Verrucomicrobiaceae bacterium]|nr:aminopeptidase [Verrucomicrobiaceae bacterium]
MLSASMSTVQSTAQGRKFPKFDLSRLLGTVFKPTFGRTICILIDLPDLAEAKDYAFLKNPARAIQKRAHDYFYQGLKNGVADELVLKGGEMYAYQQTTGSNLDLPDECVDMSGKQLSLEKDIYPNYDIILCISTFSATAPLTAFAKQYGFRGATLHGVNEVILNSGLAVDYEEVSVDAEKLRLAMTRSDWVEIDFTVENGPDMTVRLELSRQEAQKSHGLCQGDTPDVANLPAGEVYFVPTGAEGTFPLKYEDGTLGKLTVTGGRIIKAELIEGKQSTIDEHNAKLADDPMTGVLGELGFGTQVLPVSGADIQDEKVLGTCHLATGRDDHLGGHITPQKFKRHQNATHDDILFAPHKTPNFDIKQARMHRDGVTTVLIEHFQPSRYLLDALAAD